METAQAPTQAISPHHLAQFGYRRLPQWLWRTSPRLWDVVGALQDIWLIATGRCTLHRAWQAGHDAALSHEAARVAPRTIPWDAQWNRHYAPVEILAEGIYADLEYDRPGDKPRWVPNGNSEKQDLARRAARERLRACGHAVGSDNPHTQWAR